MTKLVLSSERSSIDASSKVRATRERTVTLLNSPINAYRSKLWWFDVGPFAVPFEQESLSARLIIEIDDLTTCYMV